MGDGNISRRLTIPAMHTTVLPIADIVGSAVSFWGGLTIRLRPKTRIACHATDLFSSAFVRWTSTGSFANVHANPDPIEWQRPNKFFYSMPFPPLADYECLYSLFNPYETESRGILTLYDRSGIRLRDLPYALPPRSSLLFDLRRGDYITELSEFLHKTESAHFGSKSEGGDQGGTLAIINQEGFVKNFGYMLIKQARTNRFSIEHPIHQQPSTPTTATATTPFDSAGRMKARNILYTPLVFNSAKLGGLTLKSRFHLSSGAPVEEFLWLSPFVTDSRGEVTWQMGKGTPVPDSILPRQIDHDVIKLGGQQSCILDAAQLDLPKQFLGGLSLPISAPSNHTLMKVELHAVEWNSSTFTHFRPGLASARSYQKHSFRGGLATDYIASGARLMTKAGRAVRDEIVAVINIDDKSIAGNPTLEIFGSGGVMTSVKLGVVPAFSSKHYLLSELLPGQSAATDLTLRLVDEQATLLMSVVHLDYIRRHIAADHGSDRFSTFGEFTCTSSVQKT